MGQIREEDRAPGGIGLCAVIGFDWDSRSTHQQGHRGGRVVHVDPLARDYLTNMERLAEAIGEVLK